ncbi:MAG: DNA recombination protein RmuC [Oscillospiraceae bacterium]|nr:DNA recombination protein RmuC [Oscillospiraceae bacterium]
MNGDVMAVVTLILAAVACLAAVVGLCLALTRRTGIKPADLSKMQMELYNELRAGRVESNTAIGNTLRASAENEGRQLALMQQTISDQLQTVNKRFGDLGIETELKLNQIRETMEKRITALQAENTKSLEEMRRTVDEKLQKTLDEKLNQSFKMVSERLEQVYKGLGEMQTLAAGVGDLKKVLSNVKARGILGEIQLGAILEQILSPGQYVENEVMRPGSTERVEYAVCLPGDGERPVYLPIDAKFPMDAYAQLQDAYDSASKELVDGARKELINRVKSFAKDIHDKYIAVPYTTDFAIMFLPIEGLYAELVNLGMVEALQKDYKINIAGPTTMAALLNSLQMGFKTLAIQKRSSEVWQVLSSVKAEFSTFAKALEQAQARIKQADKELDNLIGTRTRVMQRKLRQVEALPEEEEPAADLLEENSLTNSY